MNDGPKVLTRRWLEGIWNERRLEVADELMGAGCRLHDVRPGSGTIHDPREFRQIADGLLSAFPDLRVEVCDVIGEGPKAAAHCVVTATHTGPGLGVPPSGRKVRITGMVFGEWRDGKLVEGWNNFDFLSLFEQIGANA